MHSEPKGPFQLCSFLFCEVRVAGELGEGVNTRIRGVPTSGNSLDTVLRPIALAALSSSSLYFFTDPLLPQPKGAVWEKENWGEGNGGKQQKEWEDAQPPPHKPSLPTHCQLRKEVQPYSGGDTTYWESQALGEPQSNGGGTAASLKPFESRGLPGLRQLSPKVCDIETQRLTLLQHQEALAATPAPGGSERERQGSETTL